MSLNEAPEDGSVKVIDFSAAELVPIERGEKWDPTDEQKQLATLLVQEFKTVGFVCITNASIDQVQIDRIVKESKVFFNQSIDGKIKYTKGIMSNVGWTDIARENLNPAARKAGDFKETFNYQPTMEGRALPVEMDILSLWWSRGTKIAIQLMKLLGLGLGLTDPCYIADSHTFGSLENESAIRVNFYPKTIDKFLAEGQVRCGEHSDYGSITLLLQDSKGLEVINRQTGEYEAVAAPPGGIIVNIGDMLQHWTSDILVANKHRVMVAEDSEYQSKDRVSIPLFCMPDQNTEIKCLVNINKYQPVLMKDWLKQKIDAAFQERQSYHT